MNENGQYEINFECLELLTSESFVDEIKHAENVLGEKVFNIENIKNAYINVYTVSRVGLFQIYRYDCKARKESFACVTKSELNVINEYRKSVKS